MGYKYANIDKKNIEWFKNNDTVASLKNIELDQGNLRGLFKFDMTFDYPISVIAGKNGAGKTTVLALAACAFHNNEKGYKLARRKVSYYTFSDFFIQSKEEIPPSGINIYYEILYNNWKKSKTAPTGKGLGKQARKKPKNGKWNSYNLRAKRNVVYYGINRIVPHSEKSTSKSYKRKFKKLESLEFEEKIRQAVGYILNKTYDELWYTKHSGYKLPLVKIDDSIYSGFNMGAGESALFEIFSTIYFAPKGILLIIDEIELGLHDEAQMKFMTKLKEIALERKIQIIATTHSKIILEALPPEARFFIESYTNKTVITKGISPIFASGKLSGKKIGEIDIFVEDEIAKAIISNFLNHNILRRVNIVPIGSATAISRQLSAKYKYLEDKECLAIFDGDKKVEKKDLCNNFIKKLENARKVEEKEKAKEWFNKRGLFLCGDVWPERYLLNEILNCNDSLNELAKMLSIESCLLKEYIQEGINSGKHNEFYVMEEKNFKDKFLLVDMFASVVVKKNKQRFSNLEEVVKGFLN